MGWPQRQIFFLKFLKIKYSWFKMLCQSLLYSKVTQLCTCILIFYIIFHYGLSQDVEYSSLCYTVGPCCFIHSIYIAYVCKPQPPTPSLPLVNFEKWLEDICIYLFWVFLQGNFKFFKAQKVENLFIHFPSDWWCWVYFWVFIGHLFISLEICPYFNWAFAFWCYMSFYKF